MTAPTPPTPGQTPGNPNGMHPQDKRNMIIFVLASLVLWFVFDHFVLSPRADALKQARHVAAISAPQTKLAEAKIDDVILPRSDRLSENKRVVINSPEITGSISLKGGRIDDVSLKNFYTDLNNTDSVALMSPSGAEQAHYTESGWLPKDSSIKVPDANSLWSIKGGSKVLSDSSPVTLIWSNGAGVTFERSYAIDDHFMFAVTQRVINQSGQDLSLYPYTILARRGIPKGFEGGIAYEGPLGYIGDDMHEISYDDLVDEPAQSFTALNGWIGFGEKYWLSTIIPSQMREHTYRFQSVPNQNDPAQTLYQLDVRGSEILIKSGETIEDQTHVFVGAKKLSLLNDYEDQLHVRHFDLAVDFGVLYFLTKPLYIALLFFNGLVGNFGVAIIMLTFAVRALVFPLANKSYRSFAGLRKVGPKMAEIKARYGQDKPRMQQELIKLYETEKVNPMAGCFPLLLQIPIFFAVYKVITIAVEMRHAPFFGWIHDLSAMDPLSIFNLFGALPYDVPSWAHVGPWSLLMFAMLMIQKKFNPPPQDQIQKDIANYMPWIMTYMLSRFASGLVIYWAFSNLLSVIQQAVIMRSMGVPIYLFSPDAAREHHDSTTEETKKVLETVRLEKEAAEATEVEGKKE